MRGAIAQRLGVLPLLAALIALLAYPLFNMGVTSLSSPEGWWVPFVNLWEVPRYRKALYSSLFLSGWVAAGATLMCLPSAWLLARRENRVTGVLRAVLAMPMAFSGIIVGFLAVMMFGRSGVIPRFLETSFGYTGASGLAYTLSGVIVAYLWFEIPRATLTLEGALRLLDIRMLDAARTLGAGRTQRFFWVVLPMLTPALAMTFAITFAAALGSFGVVLILSVRRLFLLPLEVFYELFTPPAGMPQAAAMGLTLTVIAVLVSVLAKVAVRRFEGAQ